MKFVKVREVESSMVKEVGYDFKTSTLGVVYNSSPNLMYKYSNVDKNIYSELLKANSVGKYLHKNVLGKYNYKKVIL